MGQCILCYKNCVLNSFLFLHLGTKFVEKYSEPVAMKFEKHSKKDSHVEHEKIFYSVLSGYRKQTIK